LATRIDEILDDPRYDGSRVSVVVRSADTGEQLYSRDADSRLLPASNTKLFTSAAAMDLLGTDYRFRTTVLTERCYRRRQAGRRPLPAWRRRSDAARGQLSSAGAAGRRRRHHDGER